MPFRLKAFLVHLLFSLGIAALSAWLVYSVWYPNPLHIAMGVGVVFLILLGADVILGPLMTLLLASSPQKKGLKFDLLLIGLCQLGAYGYGMFSIAEARPVWLVFDRSFFDVVGANSIDYVEKEKITPEYQKPSWIGPKYIGLKPALDFKERDERLFYELQTGIAPSMRAHLYQSLDGSWTDISKSQKSLGELSANYQQNIAKKYSQATGWLPLKTFNDDMVVLLDVPNQKILGVEPYQH